MSPIPIPISPRHLTHLRSLEAEAIHILREAFGQFIKPMLLYSIGKDSAVMVHLARKAFYPGPIPFPLLHIDRGPENSEAADFRDWFLGSFPVRLILHTHRGEEGTGGSHDIRTTRCGLLRTKAIQDALREHDADAVLSGERRDEGRLRANEPVFSFRDAQGQYRPASQRLTLWSHYNGRVGPGEQIWAYPLSSWTEIYVWSYIAAERIPVPAPYFAKERLVVQRRGVLIPIESNAGAFPGERPVKRRCRLRSLGCPSCAGAIESDADTPDKIVEELTRFQRLSRIAHI